MTRRIIARALILPVLAAHILTTACARTGDFDRPVRDPARPQFYQEAAHRISHLFGPKQQAFPLAEAERELRARAWRFVKLDKQDTLAWDWHMDEEFRLDLFDDDGPPDPREYYAEITHPQSRSSASLWNRLIGDIRTDIELLVPLSETAFLVADLDRERRYRGGHARLVNGQELDLVARRIAANRNVMEQVALELDGRLDSYAFALEKAEIDLPDLREVEARRALVELGRLAGRIHEVLLLYDGGPAYAAPAAGKRPALPIEEVYKR